MYIKYSTCRRTLTCFFVRTQSSSIRCYVIHGTVIKAWEKLSPQMTCCLRQILSINSQNGTYKIRECGSTKASDQICEQLYFVLLFTTVCTLSCEYKSQGAVNIKAVTLIVIKYNVVLSGNVLKVCCFQLNTLQLVGICT